MITIKSASIIQTVPRYPCTWIAQTEKGNDIHFHYNNGKLSVEMRENVLYSGAVKDSPGEINTELMVKTLIKTNHFKFI